jgi:hypothetical protein
MRAPYGRTPGLLATTTVGENGWKVQKQLADVRLVAETLDPKSGGLGQRWRQFARLQEKFSRSKVSSQKQLSKQMASWVVGLFVVVVSKVPWDNLD